MADMTMQAHDSAQVREQWIERVRRLVDEVAAWSEGQGWSVHRDVKTIQERPLGAYSVQTLRVRLPQGEVHVNPIARHVMGAEGRVDLEAWPSLNRVRLLPLGGNQWKIMTDSNVPLDTPWGSDVFVQLAKHLTAAA